MKLIDLIL